MTGSTGGFTPRDVKIPFDRLGLQVGDPLYLESVDQSGRFSVRLIGFLPGQSILVTAPVVDGRQVLLKKGRPFTVRSAVKNKVFAFNSQVRHVALQPMAYVHLEYPREMLALEVRNAERVKVDIPAEVHSDFDVGLGDWPRPVLVTDISRTGAGLVSEQSIGREGDQVRLKCVLTVADITKSFSLQSVIRNRSVLDAAQAPYRYGYGVQFQNLSEAATIVLSGFVYEQQDRI